MAYVHYISTSFWGMFLLFLKGVTAYVECGRSGDYIRYCDGAKEYCCRGGYYCCSYQSYSTNGTNGTISVGAIVGIVLGSLTGLICLISVICSCIKKQTRHATVIQPQPLTGTVSYISYRGQQGQGQGQHGVNPNGTQYGMAPPPYNSEQSGSTAYNNAPPPVVNQ